MNLETNIQEAVKNAVQVIYDATINAGDILIQPTRSEYEGEMTVVMFPLAKQLKAAPPQIAEAVGKQLVASEDFIAFYQVIKGFLNLSLADNVWRAALDHIVSNPTFWKGDKTGRVLIEYSSPNTNKPLHLGHMRNILLGWSVSQILEAAGHEVIKIQIINDRGIAVCKSMLAWQKFASGATPESTGVKSDHFVGDWYVRFAKELSAEYAQWQNSDEATQVYASESNNESHEEFFKRFNNAYFNDYSSLGIEARKMLRAWEAEDPGVRALWKKMNDWVYDGYETTYKKLGVSFDKLYYESKTYLLGKEMIESGLEQGVFFRKADSSVWINLEEQGLDEKILLRADGTSVYLTQDLGTAALRYEDLNTDKMVYVVGSEQEYHFKVLFETLRKLKAPYADGLYHLSYGLVDLPDGKMKSREGTVVDADDLLADVFAEAEKATNERGEIVDTSPEERKEILRKVSLAALKFFIIKVDPKKRMLFNPAESVDMQGQTGPYVQNAFVRIQSILRKAETPGDHTDYALAPEEKALISQLLTFKEVAAHAADQMSPALIANFCYQLGQNFHRYYHEYSILKAESAAALNFRLVLIRRIAHILEEGMRLLGIEMPDRM